MTLWRRLSRLANPAHLARVISRRMAEAPDASLREDVFGLVARGVLNVCERFRFLQVGGFDGVTNDYLHEFLVSHPVQGHIVEPQSEACVALQDVYTAHTDIQIYRGAIADRVGEMALYKVAEDYRTSPDGRKIPHSIASLDPQHPFTYMRKHASWLPRDIPMEELLTQETVPVLDLRTLLQELQVDGLELLFVDAEGFDGEIVLQALALCRPRIINFEHKGLPRSERRRVWERLHASGYGLMAHRGDYGDTLAVLKTDASP